MLILRDRHARARSSATTLRWLGPPALLFFVDAENCPA